MPMGTSFKTPSGRIECSSSIHGITCRDTTMGTYFTIGDYYVHINNGAGEVTH
jgi:hypothetical protein